MAIGSRQGCQCRAGNSFLQGRANIQGMAAFLDSLCVCFPVGFQASKDLDERTHHPRPGMTWIPRAKPKNGWDTPLHDKISRDQPVVAKPTPEGARFAFIWLSATGTGCFLAAIIGGLIRGVSLGKLLTMFGHTLFRMRWAVTGNFRHAWLGVCYTILGDGRRLGLAFTHTGWFFPFFGTFLGGWVWP